MGGIKQNLYIWIVLERQPEGLLSPAIVNTTNLGNDPVNLINFRNFLRVVSLLLSDSCKFVYLVNSTTSVVQYRWRRWVTRWSQLMNVIGILRERVKFCRRSWLHIKYIYGKFLDAFSNSIKSRAKGQKAPPPSQLGRYLFVWDNK